MEYIKTKTLGMCPYLALVHSGPAADGGGTSSVIRWKTHGSSVGSARRVGGFVSFFFLFSLHTTMMTVRGFAVLFYCGCGWRVYACEDLELAARDGMDASG